jgi:hypothetical protein
LLFSGFFNGKKKPPSLAVFLESVSVFVLLLREPAATPPPLGWNG